MKIEIHHRGRSEERTLGPGEYGIGGGERDPLRFEGLEAGFARLWVEDARLSFSSEHRIRVGRAVLPAGVRRLVLGGERITLAPDVWLCPKREPEPEQDSRAVIKGLLGGRPPVEVGPRLTCLTGLDSGRVFPLGDRPVELGRGENSTVRLRDRAVSRRHAAIRRRGRGYLLEDLGATNGIFLDGVRIAGKRPLRDGAVIELGRTLLCYAAPVP